MNKQKIVLIRGLWSEPKAVRWIANNIEQATGHEVELFDYHDELVASNSPKEYLKTIIDKYEDTYGHLRGDDAPILYGHSHGAALALLIEQKFPIKKLVLSNLCLQPFGIFRRISTAFDPNYKPHFEVKYPEEVSDRINYFKDNFNLLRDMSHTLYTGIQADKIAEKVKTDILVIQSGKDEFCNVKPNLKFFKRMALPQYTPKLKLTYDGIAHKRLIWLPNAEHAVLEEQDVYPELYSQIDEFVNQR